MCLANKVSIQVSYVHLGEHDAILAIWLADVPKDMIQIFDEVLKEEVLAAFPHYQKVIMSPIVIRKPLVPISYSVIRFRFRKMCMFESSIFPF